MILASTHHTSTFNPKLIIGYPKMKALKAFSPLPQILRRCSFWLSFSLARVSLLFSHLLSDSHVQQKGFCDFYFSIYTMELGYPSIIIFLSSTYRNLTSSSHTYFITSISHLLPQLFYLIPLITLILMTCQSSSKFYFSLII